MFYRSASSEKASDSWSCSALDCEAQIFLKILKQIEISILILSSSYLAAFCDSGWCLRIVTGIGNGLKKKKSLACLARQHLTSGTGKNTRFLYIILIGTKGL